jgi:DNA-binding CsgD family transcriptional regulator
MKRIEREGPTAFVHAVMAKTEKKAASNEETNREIEVIRLIALGLANKDIAETLQISIKTVEKHRGNAMQKLNLRNTADITRYAVAAGIITIKLLPPRIIKKIMKVRIAYTINLTANDIDAFEKHFKEAPNNKKLKDFFETDAINSTERALEQVRAQKEK